MPKRVPLFPLLARALCLRAFLPEDNISLPEDEISLPEDEISLPEDEISLPVDEDESGSRTAGQVSSPRAGAVGRLGEGHGGRIAPGLHRGDAISRCAATEHARHRRLSTWGSVDKRGVAVLDAVELGALDDALAGGHDPRRGSDRRSSRSGRRLAVALAAEDVEALAATGRGMNQG